MDHIGHYSTNLDLGLWNQEGSLPIIKLLQFTIPFGDSRHVATMYITSTWVVSDRKKNHFGRLVVVVLTPPDPNPIHPFMVTVPNVFGRVSVCVCVCHECVIFGAQHIVLINIGTEHRVMSVRMIWCLGFNKWNMHWIINIYYLNRSNLTKSLGHPLLRKVESPSDL